MLFPAKPSKTHPPTITLPISATLICDDENFRDSLTQRLVLLGVALSNDLKTSNMVFVSNETSDAFLAIKPYLSANTHVVLLDNTVLYSRPMWVQVNQPLTQSKLTSLIEKIFSQRIASANQDILIVDDNPTNTRLLELQLTELGHTVEIASGGKLAINKCQSMQLDTIFVDIQMPDMSGEEATQRIRGLGSNAKIIALTAHASAQERARLKSQGIDEVHIKPIRMDSLKVLLQKNHAESRPQAVRGGSGLLLFDPELAFQNANQRVDVAIELHQILMDTIGVDQQAINSSADNLSDLKQSVHKLHGAVKYCGTPRLEEALGKLETATKDDTDNKQLKILINLVNGEIIALQTWFREHDGDINRVFMQQSSLG